MASLSYLIIVALTLSASSNCYHGYEQKETIFRQMQKQGMLFHNTHHLTNVESQAECVINCLQMAENYGGICDMIVNRKPSGTEKTDCNMYLRKCGTGTEIISSVLGLQADALPVFFAEHINQGI